MIRKLENIAAPTMKPVRLVAATDALAQDLQVDQRLVDARLDRHEHADQREPADDRRRAFAGEPQPQSRPARRRAGSPASAPERSTAPSQSTFAFSTGGEGGISRCAANAAGSAIRLIQNSHCEVEVVDDHAGQRQADAAADAEDRR